MTPDPARTLSAALPDGLRRRLLLQTGGLAALGAGLFGGGLAAPAAAQTAPPMPVPSEAVLNFALNLEYLEAEYYIRGTRGFGLTGDAVEGAGNLGAVQGGRKVPFATRSLQKIFEEIARDEVAHVAFLRRVLGDNAVARPAIDLAGGFTAAARAAGLVGPEESFDPFADENSFVIGAFLFEDVGVTAYKGAAPLLDDDTLLEAAAGILAVEAYHAGTIRTIAYMRELFTPTRAISDARDRLDRPENTDLPVIQYLDDNPQNDYSASIVPTDADALAFSRSPQEVLNIVYLGQSPGGFFPAGVNGSIR